MKNKTGFFLILAFAFICFISGAEARPGGGHTYGGSSGSSSGSDGLIELLIYIIFEILWELTGALIGERNRDILATILFVLAVIAGLIYNFLESRKKSQQVAVFTNTNKTPEKNYTGVKKKVIQGNLGELKAKDPDFSK